MEQQIIIQPQIPWCTKEKFCEMSGCTMAWLNSQIQEGLIPLLPRKSQKETAKINLYALWKETISQTPLY